MPENGVSACCTAEQIGPDDWNDRSHRAQRNQSSSTNASEQKLFHGLHLVVYVGLFVAAKPETLQTLQCDGAVGARLTVPHRDHIVFNVAGVEAVGNVRTPEVLPSLRVAQRQGRDARRVR